jgi:FEZ-like protein
VFHCCIVKGLDCLSVAALSELTDELQRCVHAYSAELVRELAHRDELDFEKELKNQFIWLLLRVQKRRREASLDIRPSPRHSRIIASGVRYFNIIHFSQTIYHRVHHFTCQWRLEV